VKLLLLVSDLTNRQGCSTTDPFTTVVNTTANLVRGKSHELFGGSFPDGRDGDDPANVVVDDRRR